MKATCGVPTSLICECRIEPLLVLRRHVQLRLVPLHAQRHERPCVGQLFGVPFSVRAGARADHHVIAGARSAQAD